MIEMFVGSIFIIMAAIMLGVSFVMGMIFAMLPMGLLFGGIGILVFKTGFKEVVRNKETAKYGEECFGKVVGHYDTGIRVNENPLYGAKVVVYINSENRTMLVKEKMGYNPNLYKVGSYVKVEYYNEDINFICEVPENMVSVSIRETIEKDTNNYSEDIKDEFDTFEAEANRREASGTQTTYTSPEEQAKVSKFVGTIFIVLATTWILFSLLFWGIFNFVSKLPADHYYLNGEEVSREEFEASGSHSVNGVFTGVFLLIGVAMLAGGIKLVLTKPTEDNKFKETNNYKEEFEHNNYEKIHETKSSGEDDPIKNL